jgi:hypothetical protein
MNTQPEQPSTREDRPSIIAGGKLPAKLYKFLVVVVDPRYGDKTTAYAELDPSLPLSKLWPDIYKVIPDPSALGFSPGAVELGNVRCWFACEDSCPRGWISDKRLWPEHMSLWAMDSLDKKGAADTIFYGRYSIQVIPHYNIPFRIRSMHGIIPPAGYSFQTGAFLTCAKLKELVASKVGLPQRTFSLCSSGRPYNYSDEKVSHLIGDSDRLLCELPMGGLQSLEIDIDPKYFPVIAAHAEKQAQCQQPSE